MPQDCHCGRSEAIPARELRNTPQPRPEGGAQRRLDLSAVARRAKAEGRAAGESGASRPWFETRRCATLLTMRPAIFLNLVLRRRAAPSRRTGHGEGRKQPMVRDASLRDAPHHEV